MQRRVDAQDWDGLIIREVDEGRGVFVEKEIRKGTVVCNYGGDFLTKEYAEINLLKHPKKCDYLVELKEISHGERKTFYLNHNNNTRFSFGKLLNHSKLHPNLSIKIFETVQNTLDVIFVARRKILQGEQLLWNYGKAFTGVDDCVSDCSRCKGKKEINKI